MIDSVDSILDKLKFYNDDYKFKFDPIKHRYTYDGEYFIPVTQFISRFHEKFDSEFLMKYRRWIPINVEFNNLGISFYKGNFFGHNIFFIKIINF